MKRGRGVDVEGRVDEGVFEEAIPQSPIETDGLDLSCYTLLDINRSPFNEQASYLDGLPSLFLCRDVASLCGGYQGRHS